MSPTSLLHYRLVRRDANPVLQHGLDHNNELLSDSSFEKTPTFNESTSLTKTTLVLIIVGTSLGGLLTLALVFKLLYRFKNIPQARKVSSHSTFLPESSPYTRAEPDKYFGSTKLSTLSQAVRRSFRQSRSSLFNRYSTSESNKNGMNPLNSFDDLLWRGGGTSQHLGLSEAELSQILANPSSESATAPGTSADTQTTLPTDSWDQYMSILKHEEHLLFEDITPVASTTHSSTDFSRHRHHPSLLSHYFHSTFGGLGHNKVEPLSHTKPLPSEEIELNGLPSHYNHAKGQLCQVTDSNESHPNLLTSYPGLATATVASGGPLRAPLTVPKPVLTSPSHPPGRNQSHTPDPISLGPTSTALAPPRKPSLEPQELNSVQVTSLGRYPSHLADTTRLSALVETSPLTPEASKSRTT